MSKFWEVHKYSQQRKNSPLIKFLYPESIKKEPLLNFINLFNNYILSCFLNLCRFLIVVESNSSQQYQTFCYILRISSKSDNLHSAGQYTENQYTRNNTPYLSRAAFEADSTQHCRCHTCKFRSYTCSAGCRSCSCN